ncbi:MAG: methylenetetrahydrofolate reductase [NAD(P)H] [Alphaproteobacteria bacterium]|tara:strand:+ start:26 stop:874 length:849 start_codon:yes stop_codon:yes gene_type:complete
MNNINVSFEFFPPKNKVSIDSLWSNIRRLEPLQPKFISVTYGAGGSTRENTHKLVKEIKKETSLTPAAHLTCIDTSVKEIERIADDYWRNNIKHIVALRGDTPKVKQGKNELRFATDLIKVLKKKFDFEITVSAYPEKHPDSRSIEQEYDILKMKIDLGANKAITQFFFDINSYFDFLDGAIKRGISIPIIPGILPVTNCKRTMEFAKKMNCKVPRSLVEMFKGLDSDIETRKLVATTIVYDQCMKLISSGIKDFHFYTLNRADLSFAICHILGIRILKDDT